MAHRRAVAAVAVGVSLLAALGTVQANRNKQNAAPAPAVSKPAPKPVKRAAASPSHSAAERQIALRWLRGMKLRDQIAQLIVITTYGEAPPRRSKAYKDYARLVRDVRVGGVIVVNRVVGGSVQSAEPYAMAAFLNRMQKLARVPLIVGADFERGASMRVSNTIKYPHLMAYGAADDPTLTRELGAATAREARALGVHWVFAPVADVNNNPDNPIINIRSFGEDPQLVAKHVGAFIEGARSDPKHRVLVTVKHFPGHGDTATDSHMGLASLTADRARMDALELVPFRAAIAHRIDAVMTAHMAVPSVEERQIPSTVSGPVLTGLLRNDLKFDGLIVTDAMDMQGLTKQFPAGEASVRALEAGADVLLMPTDPDEVVRDVMKAVNEGRLTRKRIEQSALRVLMAKARVGLHRGKLVDIDEVTDELDSPEAAEQAQTAAQKAITLVKNEGNAARVSDVSKSCLYVLAEGRYGQQGRAMIAEARRLAPEWRTVLLDPNLSPAEINDTMQRFASCEKPVIAAFVSVAAYRGNVAIAPAYTPILEGYLSRNVPVTLAALGSPYLLRSFPGVSAYYATFSTSPLSEIAIVRALVGQAPVTGKLPVSIPGHAKAGNGISLP